MTDSDTLVANKGKAVTVVASRRVFPGHENDYRDWVHKMVDAANEAPGNLGSTLLIPESGKEGLRHLLLRFADRESVLKWEWIVHPPETLSLSRLFLGP